MKNFLDFRSSLEKRSPLRLANRIVTHFPLKTNAFPNIFPPSLFIISSLSTLVLVRVLDVRVVSVGDSPNIFVNTRLGGATTKENEETTKSRNNFITEIRGPIIKGLRKILNASSTLYDENYYVIYMILFARTRKSK